MMRHTCSRSAVHAPYTLTSLRRGRRHGTQHCMAIMPFCATSSKHIASCHSCCSSEPPFSAHHPCCTVPGPHPSQPHCARPPSIHPPLGGELGGQLNLAQHRSVHALAARLVRTKLRGSRGGSRSGTRLMGGSHSAAVIEGAGLIQLLLVPLLHAAKWTLTARHVPGTPSRVAAS